MKQATITTNGKFIVKVGLRDSSEVASGGGHQWTAEDFAKRDEQLAKLGIKFKRKV